jgi:hypothetical protein
MKKLVLGIVSVFCLQMAFIVYNAVNPLPSLASITFSDRVDEDTLTLGQLDKLAAESAFPDDMEMAAAATDLPAARIGRVTTRSTDSPIEAVRRTSSLPTKAVARNVKFTPIDVSRSATRGNVVFSNEYAAVVVTPRADHRELSASDSPKSEKRSFLSNVIKKPYELIKALGSKLK